MKYAHKFGDDIFAMIRAGDGFPIIEYHQCKHLERCPVTGVLRPGPGTFGPPPADHQSSSTRVGALRRRELEHHHLMVAEFARAYVEDGRIMVTVIGYRYSDEVPYVHKFGWNDGVLIAVEDLEDDLDAVAVDDEEEEDEALYRLEEVLYDESEIPNTDDES